MRFLPLTGLEHLCVLKPTAMTTKLAGPHDILVGGVHCNLKTVQNIKIVEAKDLERIRFSFSTPQTPKLD